MASTDSPPERAGPAACACTGRSQAERPLARGDRRGALAAGRVEVMHIQGAAALVHA